MSAKPTTKAAKTTGRNKRSPKQVLADDVVIPDKLYFRIGDVAKLCDLPSYVLRFWETEFPQLAPKKSTTGQRLYRQRDVENVLRIKKLLYEEGFTIAGARQHLKLESKPQKGHPTLPFLAGNGASGRKNNLKQVKAGLQEILALLKQKR